jgi:DNA-binding PadR family transcriptional regulator
MALAHALLASLIKQSCSGYDLSKQFNSSVGFFWKASQQQIYRELSKLETEGWVSAEIVCQQGRPDKKLYQVTELGQKQLTEWIGQPCELSPIRDDLLVKIFAGSMVERQVIVEELEHHRELHQQRLAVYRDLEQRYFNNGQDLSMEAKFRYITLKRGISDETSWLTWCEEAIALCSSS